MRSSRARAHGGHRILGAVLGAVGCFGAVQPAFAIPELQLYIEGASYVGGSEETWVIGGTNSFILWAIGDVSAKGAISNVKLTAAYSNSIVTPTITLTPTTVTPAQVFSVTDPSTPIGTGTLVASPSSATSPPGPCGANGTNGTLPCLSDGTTLPSHSEFGAGVAWKEFALGNFTLTDSPIGDYITSLPSTFPDTGQINAYIVTLGGSFSSGDSVHFDLFNSIQAANGVKAINAPFSHDATGGGGGGGGGNFIPEPGSVALLGIALLGVGAVVRRRSA